MARNPIVGNPVARWMAEDAGRARPPDIAVFRYKGMIAFPVLIGVPVLVTMVAVLIGLNGEAVAEHAITPVVGWAIATLGWLGVAVTAVRVRPDGLVIDNMMIRHVIPWERFAGIDVQPGQGMFAWLDGGQVARQDVPALLAATRQ